VCICLCVCVCISIMCVICIHYKQHDSYLRDDLHKYRSLFSRTDVSWSAVVSKHNGYQQLHICDNLCDTTTCARATGTHQNVLYCCTGGRNTQDVNKHLCSTYIHTFIHATCQQRKNRCTSVIECILKIRCLEQSRAGASHQGVSVHTFSCVNT